MHQKKKDTWNYTSSSLLAEAWRKKLKLSMLVYKAPHLVYKQPFDNLICISFPERKEKKNHITRYYAEGCLRWMVFKASMIRVGPGLTSREHTSRKLLECTKHISLVTPMIGLVQVQANNLIATPRLWWQISCSDVDMGNEPSIQLNSF